MPCRVESPLLSTLKNIILADLQDNSYFSTAKLNANKLIMTMFSC